MREIPLVNGGVALIDAEDWPLVSGFSWRRVKNGHIWYVMAQFRRSGIKKWVRMHRLIMKTTPGQRVDHKSRNALDNRKSNLRIASRAENRANSRKTEGTSSKYKGVWWSRKQKCWCASTKQNRRTIHLGSFGTEKDAALAYDVKARELFGDFARLNFPPKGEPLKT